MTTRSIVVVSGGLRSPSSTRILADQLGEAARAALAADGPGGAGDERGAHADTGAGTDAGTDAITLRTVELREHAHAITDALLTGFPTGSLREAVDAVVGADALLVVTPVFQGSYSGLFKSFFDLVEAGSIRGVPVLLAATGGTERHSLVIEHALRPMFSYLGAVTVPTGVYAATADFGGEGTPALRGRIERAAGELATLVSGRERARPGAQPARPGALPARPGAQPAQRGAPPAADGIVPFEELLRAGGHGPGGHGPGGAR